MFLRGGGELGACILVIPGLHFEVFSVEGLCGAEIIRHIGKLDSTTITAGILEIDRGTGHVMKVP